MYGSIKEFVDFLAANDELTVIDDYANPSQEIAARSCEEAAKPDGGKALLFKETGTGYPVLTNIFSSRRRMGFVIGSASVEEARGRMEQFQAKIPMLGQGLKGYIEAIALSKEMSEWSPNYISRHAPCHDSIQNIAHLSLIPFIRSSAKAPSVLSPVLVNSRHPKTGLRVLEPDVLYPVDECTAGLKISPHGDVAAHLAECTHRLPLAVCLGGDPVYDFIAAAPKIGVDPYMLAGFFRGKGVSLIQTFTQGIEVPADSDMVMEGYVQKSEERTEEGLYKFHITCITHRRGAILPVVIDSAQSPGKGNVRHAVEKIFVEPLRRTVAKTNELLLLTEEVFYSTH